MPVVDNLIWNAFARFLTKPELIRAQAERWMKQVRQGVQGSFNQDRLDRLQQDLAEIEKKKDRLVEAFTNGVIELEQLKVRQQEFATKEQDIKEKVRELEDKQKQISTNLPSFDTIEQFCEQTKEYITNLTFEIKKQLIQRVVDRVVLTQSEAKIYGYLPVPAEENIVYESIHRHRGSPECG